MTTPTKQQTITRIIEFVTARYGITRNQIMSDQRPFEIVWPRWVAMALISDEGMGLTQIGRVFNKNHGTVCHVLKRYKQMIETDARYRRDWDEVKKEMGRA